MGKSLLLLCLVPTLAACSPVPTFGVADNTSGPEVLVSRCPDERVVEVSVQREDSGGGGIVKGPVLWRITSNKGVAVDAVTIGVTPKGFETDVALGGSLPSDAELVVYVTTTYAAGNMGVRLSDLRQGKVAVFGENVSRQEFEGEAKNC